MLQRGKAKERWPDLRLVTDGDTGQDEQDNLHTGEPRGSQDSPSEADHG